MSSGKPDPECRECKGTGQIILFTSVAVCDCVNKPSTYDRIGEMKFYKKPYDDPFQQYEKLSNNPIIDFKGTKR